MPKVKTHKGVAKRVKITKTGKVKRNKAFRGHLMSGKSGERKRRLRRPETMSGAESKRFKRLLNLR